MRAQLIAAALAGALLAGCGAQAPAAKAPAQQPAPAASAAAQPAAPAPTQSAPAPSASALSAAAQLQTTAPAPQQAAAPAKVEEIVIEAGEIDDNKYLYKPEKVTVPAGTRVKLTLKNVGNKRHDLGVIGWAGAPQTETVQPGQSQTLEFTPPRAGEFSLVCSLRGHKDKGMQIPFIVTP